MQEVIKIEDQGDPLNGIIKYIRTCLNSDTEIEKTILAESSSSLGISYRAENVLRSDKKWFFCSGEEKNASLTLDFGNLRITPSGYTMKSRHWNGHFPTDWILQGSNDKIEWLLLHEVKDENGLKLPGKTNTFKISQNNSPDKSYRYIQIVLTDVSSDGKFHLSFNSIEFFGILYKC